MATSGCALASMPFTTFAHLLCATGHHGFRRSLHIADANLAGRVGTVQRPSPVVLVRQVLADSIKSSPSSAARVLRVSLVLCSCSEPLVHIAGRLAIVLAEC